MIEGWIDSKLSTPFFISVDSRDKLNREQAPHFHNSFCLIKICFIKFYNIAFIVRANTTKGKHIDGYKIGYFQC